MTEDEFCEIVEEALDTMPDRFLDALDNVAIVVESEPQDWQLEELEPGEGTYANDELLGLYEGINLVDRADGYDDAAPDVITVFQGPHERCFATRGELVDEVRKTVIHEIGHYFGIDDARLHEMGY